MKPAIAAFYRHYPVTATFIALSIVLSLVTGFGYFKQPLMGLVFDQEAILSGQIWRLVTPIFLHFPAFGIVFAHLAFNMIWLYFFGIRLERFEGSGFLLLLILLIALGSNVAQSWVSLGIFGGMSGVVYGLLGYLFIQGKFNRGYPHSVPDNLAYFLIGFMLVSMTGLLGSQIANTAHVVGFLLGATVALPRLKRN